MARRLSELLERIRPAGTPGAPADATPQRAQAALDEIADVAALLSEFEAEADAVVAAARREAATIRSSAAQAAQRIRDEVPDRVAVAQARSTVAAEQSSGTAAEQIVADAEAEVEALLARPGIDRIVDEAVAALWQLAGSAP